MRDWITVVKVAKYREPQTPPKAVSTANQIKPDTGNNPENKNVNPIAIYIPLINRISFQRYFLSPSKAPASKAPPPHETSTKLTWKAFPAK